MTDGRQLTLDTASLQALELDKVLALVGCLAVTDRGRRRLLELRPQRDLGTLETRQLLALEVAGLLAESGNLVPSLECSTNALAATLEDPRSWLEPEALLQLIQLLDAVLTFARRVLRTAPDQASGNDDLDAARTPRLEALVAATLSPVALEALRGLVLRVRRTLDPSGEIRPDASPRLSTLRTRLRSQRDGLQRAFEGYVQAHRGELGEETVSQRDGRFSVLLPTGHKGRLTGIVHGRSGTGHSYYFEPLELIDGNNELELTRCAEAAERQRLLAEIERAVREQRNEVLAALELLSELDTLQAIAVFARLTDARFVPLTEQGTRLIGARHPLLDPKLAALRESTLGVAGNREHVVPLDLDFGHDRVVVVTGPNAGGKTVVLKTLGLLTAMTHCGLPIAAAEGTRITTVERLVAVVGDQQSLLVDRSTFSGQLLRWKAAWEAAGPRSLILVDELGSGTNPQEGGALGLSLLESLCERGGWALLTTHLIEIAAATYELPAARALAMEFDAETALPTFRLRTSGLGGSEALALARRLGLPAEWIERAEARLGPDQRDLRRLLEEADRLRIEAASEHARALEERRRAEGSRRALDDELSTAREQRQSLRRQVERELAGFRRQAKQRLERELEELSTRLPEQPSTRSRRKAAEQAVSRVLAHAPAPPAVDQPAEPLETSLLVGADVTHRSLGWTGRLRRLDSGRAEVSVHGKRVFCEASELRITRNTSRSPAAAATIQQPEAPEMATQINLVGQRVAPALSALDDYLDRALRGTADQLRVIHGHGSGTLRRAIREHLKDHPAVASVAPAGEDEGGNGATIVTLRGGS